MNRKKILEVVKGLDESGTYRYLYDVLTDGSSISENWLDELEERKPTNEKELIDALVDLNIVENIGYASAYTICGTIIVIIYIVIK